MEHHNSIPRLQVAVWLGAREPGNEVRSTVTYLSVITDCHPFDYQGLIVRLTTQLQVRRK